MIWYGLAYIAYLIYNWGTYRYHSFFWNIANSLIITWFCFEASNQILSQNNLNPSSIRKDNNVKGKVEDKPKS